MEPKIRIKGFQREWKELAFSDSFDSLKNNSLSRAELSESGSVYNIHYGDVLISYNECVEVDKEVKTFVKDAEFARKLKQSCAIKNGDIIFADAAEDNTVGKCTEVIAQEADAIVSGLHTIPCRPKKEFASRYLGYYLNSNAFHDQLLPHIQGTKISSISKRALAQTYISYPSDKNEQQAIASYFQHLDSLIQSTTKKIESLKQVKAASLQSMFPQEGETKPRVRFKGFEGEWETLVLGEVGTFKSNGVDKLIRPNEKIINLLNYLDVYNSRRITKENCNSLMQVSASDRQIKECDVRRNDIFFTPSSETAEDVGYVLVMIDDLPNTCYSYHLMRYRPYEGVFYDDFPNYGFMTGFVRSQMKFLAKGVQRFVIGKPEFESIKVQVPSYDEQEKISQYFRNLDIQISLQTQRLEKLKQIKSACLDNMFV